MKFLPYNCLKITVIEDDGQHSYLAVIDVKKSQIRGIYWNKDDNDQEKYFVVLQFVDDTSKTYQISEEEYKEIHIMLYNRVNLIPTPELIQKRIINSIMELEV